MTGIEFLGLVMFGLGAVLGALSVHQLVTGRGHWMRKPTLPPTPEQIRGGAWLGIAIAAMFMLAGLSRLTDATVAGIFGTAGFGMLLVGGLWSTVKGLKPGTSPGTDSVVSESVKPSEKSE